MKTFAVFLCLIATTADAAPLHLTCKGKEYDVRYPSDSEPVTYSIKIDGTNVGVEGGDPVQIYSDDGDTWAFGNTVGQPLHGTINRITGHVQITFSMRTSKKPTLQRSTACAIKPKNFSSGGEGER
jgi:hypothetical protein